MLLRVRRRQARDAGGPTLLFAARASRASGGHRRREVGPCGGISGPGHEHGLPGHNTLAPAG